MCGDNCDTCLPGFFNLRTENPDGCDPCFCFSITEKCQSSTWGRNEVRSFIIIIIHVTLDVLCADDLKFRLFYFDDLFLISLDACLEIFGKRYGCYQLFALIFANNLNLFSFFLFVLCIGVFS